MKLLLYAHDWAPTIGGIQTITLELARGLAEQGTKHGGPAVEVTVATPTPAGGMNDAALPFRVVREPDLGELTSLIKRADVIHLAGPCLLPMFLGWLLRKPVVVEHHGFHAVCPNGLLLYEPTRTPCPGHFMARRHWKCLRCNRKDGTLRSLSMWLLTFARRWLSQRSSVNIVPTDWVAAVLKLPRMSTIYHGLPLPRTKATATAPNPTITFAFQGRLVGAKGGQLLLQAAARLKKMGGAFQLKIIGEGPDHEMLEAMARRLDVGDCVTFLGHLPDEEIENVLAGTAATVIPSLGGEVFGLVAAENMLRSRPAIVPEGEALAEVVGETGLTFPIGDVVGLANCMARVLENPSLSRELGEKACLRAGQLFRLERMVEEHLRTYEGTLPARELPC